MMTSVELWKRFFGHQTRCPRCARFDVAACPVGQALIGAAYRAEKIEKALHADATGCP